MADANVSVVFSASTADFEGGVAAVRDALSGLSGAVGDLNGKYAALGAALSESHARAVQAIRDGDKAAYSDSLRGAQEALSGQIKAEQDSLRDKLALYSEDVRFHRMFLDDKALLGREAVEQSYAAEFELMQRKRALVQGSFDQRQRIDNEIAQLERNEQRQLAQLTRESLNEQTRDYERFGQAVSKAFESQLRGLLSGTQSWSGAFRNVLSQLVVDFIIQGERMVVQWAVSEAAKTSATAAGTATRAGLEGAGASASLAVQGAAMIRSILGSAAETFAGVFGFLAPVMGPFAAGPAAAAQATVASAVGAVASADIGMWSVPADMLTLVHHNELIMPAAEAGVFRDMLSGGSRGAQSGSNVSITPTTHFHVNAIDGGSVAQWMRANSGELLRAVDEAVRHGAHLGLRRLAGA